MSDDEGYDAAAGIAPLFAVAADTNVYRVKDTILKIRTRHDKNVVHIDGANGTAGSSAAQQPKLFVDDVWPGSLVLADYIVSHPEFVLGKSVIELGAGAALPSMVACKLGAQYTMATDYPARSVIENISELIAENHLENMDCRGHIWGSEDVTVSKRYDVVLVAEPLWKDTYPLHRALLRSIDALLKDDGVCYLTFAHREALCGHGVEHTLDHNLELFMIASIEFNINSQLINTVDKYNDVGENVPIEVYIYCMKKRKDTNNI